MFIRMLMLVATSLWATGTWAADACEIPRGDVLRSVVRVVGDGVEGSGVIVDRDRVITAAHVIDGIRDLHVNFDGIRRSARVSIVFPDKDIALLEVDTAFLRPLRFLERPLSAEELVWAVGYPLGGNQLASSGHYRGDVHGDLHTTASVNHGQSGGALLTCDDGQFVLAGMITAFGAVERGGNLVRLDDYSVSLPAEEIRRFLKSSTQLARR